MAINEKYSYKDFMGQDFSKLDASEFNGTEIVGSCFYQEWQAGDTLKSIFPAGMTGVTFRRCNLDNVDVPVGNTVESDCCHRRIRVQNDMEDWVLDATDKPVEPVCKKRFQQLGLSIDPTDIPKGFLREEELSKAEFDAIKTDNSFTQWWMETPAIVEQVTRMTVKVVQKEAWEASVDKAVWESAFDVKPTVTVNGDTVKVEGNITTYKIRGKGKFMVSGVKPRPCLNRPITLQGTQNDY